MKYGLDMASAGPAGDAQTMGELAHIAEDSGWDGIFLEDYIIWQSHPNVPTYDPWITLATIALRTQRIRLGTMVTPIPRRRLWKLAQELVTLDHLYPNVAQTGPATANSDLGGRRLSESRTRHTRSALGWILHVQTTRTLDAA